VSRTPRTRDRKGPDSLEIITCKNRFLVVHPPCAVTRVRAARADGGAESGVEAVTVLAGCTTCHATVSRPRSFVRHAEPDPVAWPGGGRHQTSSELHNAEPPPQRAGGAPRPPTLPGPGSPLGGGPPTAPSEPPSPGAVGGARRPRRDQPHGHIAGRYRG